MSDPAPMSEFERVLQTVSAFSPILTVVLGTVERIAADIAENQRLNDQERAAALAALRGNVRISVERAVGGPVYDPATGTVRGTPPAGTGPTIPPYGGVPAK